MPVLTTLQPAVTTHTHEPLRTTASTGQMTALKDRVNLDCKSRLGPFREAAMSRPARWSGGKRWFPLVGVGALLGLVGSVGFAAGVSAARTSAPHTVPSNFTYANSLNNLSCPSSTFCVGVGSYDGFYQPDDRDMDGTLAEEWNGSSWSMFETPNPAMPGFNEGYESSFSGVSCTSSTFCVAVGQSSELELVYTLAEVWNGSVWSITPTWNATNEPTGLSGVSCTSPTFCSAVGSYGLTDDPAGVQPLAEEWNGSAWSQVTIPTGEDSTSTYLHKINCTSATFCVAVGSSGSFNLIEEWDGTSWSVEQAPNPVGDAEPWLTDVSCSSDTFCATVGQGFADTLEGTTWSIETVPSANGATQDQLNGVSCTSPTFCSTVGVYLNSSNKWVSQAATWDGTSWTLQNTASLKHNSTSGLSDVVCSSSTSCLAVGGHTVRGQSGDALLEQWDGTAWNLQSAPGVVPLDIAPDSGPPGKRISITGFGFSPDASMRVTFLPDSSGELLCSATTEANGTYSCRAKIPTSMAATRGPHYVLAKEGDDLMAVGIFTVT